jgi:two-component system CheB/CheR fusion protein
MPRSAINSGFIDRVLSVAEIIPTALQFLDHTLEAQVAEEEEPDEIDEILELVRDRSDHDFTEYKPSSLARRIQRRMGLLHVQSLEEYR